MAAPAHSHQPNIPTGKKTNETERKPEPEAAHDEFLIAADLTLYANPLRCLIKKPDPSQRSGKETKQAQELNPKDTEDIIAADLTKYGSPLDDKN